MRRCSSILSRRAQSEPERVAYTFLPDGLTDGPSLTYGELDRQARALAARLARHSAPGDRALLLYPQSLDFIVAFFGCLYAGIVGIPAYPPPVRTKVGKEFWRSPPTLNRFLP